MSSIYLNNPLVECSACYELFYFLEEYEEHWYRAHLICGICKEVFRKKTVEESLLAFDRHIVRDNYERGLKRKGRECYVARSLERLSSP